MNIFSGNKQSLCYCYPSTRERELWCIVTLSDPHPPWVGRREGEREVIGY